MQKWITLKPINKMSQFLPVGSVIDYRRDRFATNGDHLDVRIIPKYGPNAGVEIDPATRPNLLNRIFIGSGDNRRSLTSYPLTSGFGPRDTGIPGASKYHKGQDYGIAAGNEIFLQGGTSYFSQNGVGVATLNDAEGNPYEIEFFHTDVGEPLGVSDQPQRVSSQSASAKAKAQAYQDMSKSQLDSAYDGMRSDTARAEEEGMKMHKAYFGKP